MIPRKVTKKQLEVKFAKNVGHLPSNLSVNSFESFFVFIHGLRKYVFLIERSSNFAE